MPEATSNTAKPMASAATPPDVGLNAATGEAASSSVQ